MPIENERKYILSLTPEHINGLICDYGGIHQHIRQAYVDGARIRGVEYRGGPPGEEYSFTWKKRRADGSRLEIETELSQEDFDELWQVANKVITKDRIKIKGYGVTWDIDFLFSGEYIFNSHYLTIAEVEMPEGTDLPNVTPDFIKDSLLYLVPRNQDHKWVNPNLTDPEKVRRMLKNAIETEE